MTAGPRSPPQPHRCWRSLIGVVAAVVTATLVCVGLSLAMDRAYTAYSCSTYGEATCRKPGQGRPAAAGWPLDPLDNDARYHARTWQLLCYHDCSETRASSTSSASGGAGVCRAPEVTSTAFLNPDDGAAPRVMGGTDQISLWCGLSAIDITSYTATMGCGMFFSGRYDQQVPLPGRPGSPNLGLRPPREGVVLVVWLERQKYVIRAGEQPGSMMQNMQIGSAFASRQRNSEWYPFVALHSEFVYKAFWSADNGTTALAGVPLPLAVQLSFDFVPMYQVTNARCRKGATSAEWSAITYMLEINNIVKRVALGALNVCLWAVTACMLALSLLSAFGRRRRDDVLGFAAGLMFALPTVRGLLPAVPGGGVWFDLITIHSQIWLTSVSIILQFLRIFYDCATAPATQQARQPTAQREPCDKSAGPANKSTC